MDTNLAQAIAAAERFDQRELAALAYANRFTLWHYRGQFTPLEEMLEPGWWNGAADLVRLGDMVLVNAMGRSTILTVVRPGPAPVLRPLTP